MPQVFYNEDEYNKVKASADAGYNVLRFTLGKLYGTHTDDSVVFKKNNSDSYPFIPNSYKNVMNDFLEFKKEIYNKKPKDFNFLDAGCGFPIVIRLFDQLDISCNCVGYEIDPRFTSLPGVKNVDLLSDKAQYNKFDVIYYYCPFDNYKKEIEFEHKVENEMKVGAYLMPYLKRDVEIAKDNRFKQVLKTSTGTLVYQKIKE